MPIRRPHGTSKPPQGTPLAAGGLAALARGYMPLNEGSGPPIDVASATPCVSNTLPWAQSARGPVLSNTQATKYAQLYSPPGSPLDVTGTAITLACWVNPTISNAYQALIVRTGGAGAANRQYGFFLSTNGTSQLYFYMSGPAGPGQINVSPGWATGVWQHVAVTYDGAAARAYINGVPCGTAAASGAMVSVAGAATYVGFDAGFGQFGLGGMIDAPAVFGAVLTPSQVAGLYRDTNQLLEERPYYRLIGAASAPASSGPPTKLPGKNTYKWIPHRHRVLRIAR